MQPGRSQNGWQTGRPSATNEEQGHEGCNGRYRRLARWADPASAAWPAAALEAAKAYVETIDTAAVMIVAGGRVAPARGTVAAHCNVHSIRKSLLSALFGIHEAEGRIGLEETLEKLGIDDKQGLTEREKMAIVLHLIHNAAPKSTLSRFPR